jgi:hypothetical protein
VIPILVDDAWMPQRERVTSDPCPAGPPERSGDQAEAMGDIIRGQLRSVPVNVALDRMSLELLRRSADGTGPKPPRRRGHSPSPPTGSALGRSRHLAGLARSERLLLASAVRGHKTAASGQVG